MLLNFARPQLAPNIVTAPSSNFDRNAILGLSPSQYNGLQTVGNTGFLYGNNRMYEPYTPVDRYYTMGSMNQKQYYQPSLMMGMGRPNPEGNYGMGSRFILEKGEEEGTIYKNGQAFRPVNADVTGFVKTKGVNDIYDYAPSMAYINTNAPRFVPTPTPNMMSFLTSPTMPSYSGNFGAGRFLNTGNLLGFNFGTPSGQTAGGETTS